MRRLGKESKEVYSTTYLCCNDYPLICSHFSISEYPTFLFFFSSREEYVARYNGNATTKSLNDFVEEFLFPKVTIFNESEQMNDESRLVLCNQQSQNIIAYSRAVGLNAVISETKLCSRNKLHLTEKCYISYKITKDPDYLMQRVMHNIYSYYKHFSFNDLISYKPNIPMILFVTNNISIYKAIILSISVDLCQKYVIGWTNPQIDSRISVYLKSKSLDYVAYIDRVHFKLKIMDSIISSTNISSFIIEAERNSKPYIFSIIIIVLSSLILLFPRLHHLFTL